MKRYLLNKEVIEGLGVPKRIMTLDEIKKSIVFEYDKENKQYYLLNFKIGKIHKDKFIFVGFWEPTEKAFKKVEKEIKERIKAGLLKNASPV